MKRKLNPDADFKNFMQKVQSCQGKVQFRTVGGDLLDLGSSISQYVFLAKKAGMLHAMDGWLEVEEEQDLALLAEYLLE